jgi:hypothetical protein
MHPSVTTGKRFTVHPADGSIFSYCVQDNFFHYNRADFASENMKFSELVDKMQTGDGTAYYLAQGNIQV